MGSPIEPERFCDTNLGRAMDKVLQTGTQKIFSPLAQNALKGLRYEYPITAAIPESAEKVGPLGEQKIRKANRYILWLAFSDD